MTLQILRNVHVLLFVCNTLAYYEFDENTLNVGTVLFSASDLPKQKWSQQNIAILRARKYFQQLIPPPHFLRTADDHYVDELFKYFKDTYINIKKHAIDPESDKIMTIALSDTIGGYLKQWVLPITKYAFYGGTVSQDNVIKILNFYDDIKSYLATDGQGWCQPKQDLFKSTSMNVAPPKHMTERNMQNPCEKLSYFEQTPSGLTVPMPYVKWNKELSTMFVPLKNLSIISLNSPSSVVDPLTIYYDVAKRCTETIKLKDNNDFDDKFHVWLCNDVIPHLNDDHVYLGLGNVLSLVDSIKEACDDGDVDFKPPICGAKRFSKKTIIFITLLLIESAWCILALLLLLRKKIKNYNRSSKGNNTTGSLDTTSKGINAVNILTNNQTSYTKSIIDTSSKWTNTSEKVSIASSSVSDLPAPMTGIKLSNKQQLRNVALATNVSMFLAQNSIGTGSEIHYSSKMCSTSVANIINESPSTHVKARSKISRSHDKIKIPSQVKCLCSKTEFIPDCAKYCCSKSIISKQEKKHHKKTRVVKETKKAKKVIKEFCKETHESKMIGDAVTDTSKCLPCITPDPIVKQPVIQNAGTLPKCIETKLCFQRDIYCKGGKLIPDKPYVQVTIDRPEKEITVIHSINIQSVKLAKTLKPSRIPKLASISPDSPRKPPSPRKPLKLASSINRKSHIPLLTKRSIDDLAIKKERVLKNDNLNVTL